MNDYEQIPKMLFPINGQQHSLYNGKEMEAFQLGEEGAPLPGVPITSLPEGWVHTAAAPSQGCLSRVPFWSPPTFLGPGRAFW